MARRKERRAKRKLSQSHDSADGAKPAKRARLSPSDNDFSSRTSATTRAFLTESTFDELDISQESMRAIRDKMGYSVMTKVQEGTIPISLSGVDVMAKAKTGTGKTLAFLIPTVERIVKDLSADPGVRALCISPTRELAMQIEAECRALTTFHRGFMTQSIYGGTKRHLDLRKFSRRVDLLVATPGRLLDHLENTPSFNLKAAHTLILDEADQLLEMGFQDEIRKIVSFMPSERQSLLFSATMPKAVRAVSNIVLKPKHKFIDCVGDDDQDSVKQVLQYQLIVDELHEILPTLLTLLHKAKTERPDDYKVIVFFVTARCTGCYCEAVNEMEGFEVLEMHSKKSQKYRTRISDEFRKATRGIMFSSDVSARGLDYPNISHVIQIGLPQSREQYVHRLGRTARAGKKGKCILVLCQWEKWFLKHLENLPLKDYAYHEGRPQCPWPQQQVNAAMERVPVFTRSRCYGTWMGYYVYNLSSKKKQRIDWTKEELVAKANEFAKRGLRLEEQPRLRKNAIGNMGLKGVPGLLIDETPQQNTNRGRDGGGVRRGGGGSGRGGGRRGGFRRSRR